MNPNELPLLRVFNALREKADLPLGIDEYLLALRALRSGLGWKDPESLKQLCCLLWAKSPQEAQRVRSMLDRLIVEPVSPQMVAPMEDEVPTPDGSEDRTDTAENPTPATPSLTANSVQQGAEAVQLVRLNRMGTNSTEINPVHFQLLTDYFPVTKRQMKQSWRRFRRQVREGPATEIDVEATVARISREGVLLSPVLVPRRVNRARLLLLLDQDGSMVPFHNLTQQLRDTLRFGGQLRQTTVYYFHDYPDADLYTDRALLKSVPTETVLEGLNERTGVLIVSDSGAARGKYEQKRIDDTAKFVEILNKRVRYAAWLNPMPSTRWANTSAGPIAHLIPMFEMSRQGLDAAISTLRGRHVESEKPYSWIMNQLAQKHAPQLNR